MLKQSIFFKKLKRKNITVQQYYILFQLYGKPMLNRNAMQILKEKFPSIIEYINEDCTLNEQGEKLIKNMETLFKPQKQLKAMDLLGDDYEEKITEYIEIFPTGKLPNKKYARGNKKEIEENFKWFFQEYHYDWKVIINATEKYVEEYRKDNFKYMRTAMYFIKKQRNGVIESDLATYCEAYLTGDLETKVVHKRKVV
jgi:hypothetical protein